MKTHKELVLKHMEKYSTITSMEAITLFGDTRLSDTIYRLKRDGHKIKTITEHKKNRYGRTVSYAKYELEGKNDKN